MCLESQPSELRAPGRAASMAGKEGGRAEERAKVLAEVASGENPDGLADMFSGQREGRCCS